MIRLLTKSGSFFLMTLVLSTSGCSPFQPWTQTGENLSKDDEFIEMLAMEELDKETHEINPFYNFPISIPTRLLELPQLGQRNTGSTCFANATHKLLMMHPKILELTSPKRKLSPGNLYEKRMLVKAAYHRLFRSLLSGNDSGDHHEKELRSAYYRFTDYVTQRAGTFARTRIGRGPHDPQEYLVELMEILEFSEKIPTMTAVAKNNVSEIIFHDSLFHVYPPAFDGESLGNAILEYQKYTATLIDGSQENKALDHLILWNLPNFENHRRNDVSNEIKVEFHNREETLRTGTPAGLRTEYYRPKAVIVHSSGHYFAFLFDKKTLNWSRHDDMEVTDLRTSELTWRHFNASARENGYLFLYENIKSFPYSL